MSESMTEGNHYTAEQIAAILTQRGNAWAEADYAANLMENTKKTLQANLVLKYLGHPPDEGARRMAVSEAESRAWADPEYKQFVEQACALRRDAHKARVSYDSAKAFSELFRTEQANLRTEMQSMSRTK